MTPGNAGRGAADPAAEPVASGLLCPNGLAAGSLAALVVFAKVPAAGAVKTRLTPPLTPREAATLYQAFLTDALHAFTGLGVAVRLYLPPSEAAMPAGVVPAGVSVHAQRGEGLGARMEAALDETLAAGYARAVVIGTDHPTLPLGVVPEALEALRAPGTVAVGPSDDGGFYLLGIDRPRPELFARMTYSHPGVFEATCARAGSGALRVLPRWYDVDDAESLARLEADVRAGVPVGPRTGAVLASLGARLTAHAPARLSVGGPGQPM